MLGYVENPIGPGSKLGNKLGNFCTGCSGKKLYTRKINVFPNTSSENCTFTLIGNCSFSTLVK